MVPPAGNARPATLWHAEQAGPPFWKRTVPRNRARPTATESGSDPTEALGCAINGTVNSKLKTKAVGIDPAPFWHG